MLRAKTYHIYKEKTLYGRNRYFLQDKIRIECLGGESMSKEKELVFIKPKDIPRLFRGSIGRNWRKMFDKIPKGEVAVLDTEAYGSAPNIRAQVKFYNQDKKDKVLKVTQRTDKKTGEITVYVQRVK